MQRNDPRLCSRRGFEEIGFGSPTLAATADMLPAQPISPTEALRAFAGGLNPLDPQQVDLRTLVGDAAVLADSIEVSCAVTVQGAAEPIAARNGYAVGAHHRAGAVYDLLGVCVVGGVQDCLGRGVPEADPSSDVTAADFLTPTSLWRVESGAPLPTGTDRVLPLDAATIVGTARVRIDAACAPGEGIAHPSQAGRMRVDAGSRLDPRLRTLLLRQGIESVRVRSPAPIGYGVIGDELVDLDASVAAGTSVIRPDLTGYWLGATLEERGHTVVPLGILPDHPQRLADTLHHAQRRGLRTLVLAGGAGRGFTDRTVEAFRRLRARFLVESVALRPATALLLAKSQGVDIICLPGAPLLAAAFFDLFVVPALAAQLGIAQAAWDWSTQAVQREDLTAEESWQLLPVIRRHGETTILSSSAARLRLSAPVLLAQVGWAVVRPSTERRRAVVYTVYSSERGRP